MATTATIGASSRVSGFPPTGPRKIISATVVTDGSDGASAGDIPASVFGLTAIEVAFPAVKSDNTLLVALAPAYNGASLLGKAAATAAPADIPAGTYLVTLIGY